MAPTAAPANLKPPLDPCAILERARVQCMASMSKTENLFQGALGWVMGWHAHCHLQGHWQPIQRENIYDTILFVIDIMGGNPTESKAEVTFSQALAHLCRDGILQKLQRRESTFICDNCGESGGSPVHIDGKESRATGYTDDFDGCTVCVKPRVRPPAALEVPLYDPEAYMEEEPRF